jgi:hypothetical protein
LLIMNNHDEPRVIPGRYAGEAIQLNDGPTPQAAGYEEQRSHADALAGRICAAAAEAARSQYVLLELLGSSTPSEASSTGAGSNRWRIGCRGHVP